MSAEAIINTGVNNVGNQLYKDKIVAKNVGVEYNIRRASDAKIEKFQAVKDFNISIRSGEFLSIVGPSGCGKSTFLDIVAGLHGGGSKGEVYIDGKLIKGPALDRGIVMQGYALFPWRTIQKNIEFGLEIKKVKKKERAEISKYFLELVGLKGFENRYPHELSGGMKQRVAIARALAYDPEVLLMDEPFAAVDEQTREVLQYELLKIWEKTKKTIIFITHSIEEAVYLSDRVAVMTKNPGTLKEIIDINLPRPRDNGELRTSADFSILRHRIWSLLHEAQTGDKPNPSQGQDVAEKISKYAAL